MMSREEIAEDILNRASYACRVGGTNEQLTLDMRLVEDLRMSREAINEFFENIQEYDSISPSHEEWAAVSTLGDLVELVLAHQTKKWFSAGTSILLEDALTYFSYKDEHHFFTWPESIPAVMSVWGKPDGLEVKLQNLDRRSLLELLTIMNRYGLNKKCLSSLCIPQNESWFKNKKAHWYADVFGA